MISTAPIHILPRYQKEVADELSAVLDYWMNHAVDRKQGGFWGRVNNSNVPDADAPKGVVLNSRILWVFSAAYLKDKKPSYFDMAARAYQYIVDHFIDRKYGGVYWSVDCKGRILDGRKQIYGLAFCMYGLSEYYKITRDEVALHLAENLFNQVEKNSFDKKNGGYFEAFTQGWKLIDDMRLSEKDANEKKTMNTHLHIIEAYANLYTIWPDQRLLESIRHLLDIFEQHIINTKNSHLHLFMDEEWRPRSSLISYGHDIEAAWLLPACAEVTGNENYISRFKELSVRIADAAAKGLDSDGGLWYEYDPGKNELIREKHSWPQAEAMVGFLNAYQLTGNAKYLHRSINAWEFVKKYIKDNNNGEWFWGVNADYSVMQKEKAGFWKCPYHNARACMEFLRRIATLDSHRFDQN
jgi:mannobiose 2-epimerase